MRDVRRDVAAFVEQYGAVASCEDYSAVSNEFDVFERLGIDGDDAFEFIDRFGDRFGTDMSAYRWYFHHGEEGINIAGLLFPPPYRRVSRIPVTFDTLVLAAESGVWPIQYPPHNLPPVRRDLQVNLGCVIVALVVLVVSLANWVWTQLA